MKIKKLEIKNFLGISEKQLLPGKVNIIKGKNGKGKTSILEAIEKALSNNNRRTKIIKENANKAELLIELDDGTEISRNITEKGNYLTVKKDGFNQKAPQTLLNNLVGRFSFNPVDFIEADEKEQTEILLNLIDINLSEDDIRKWVGDEPLPMVDYSQHGLQVIENLYKQFYEKRRDVNSEAKVLNNKYGLEMEKLPNNFDPEKYRNVSLKDKYNELREAQEHNRTLEKSEQTIKELKQLRESKIQYAEQIHKDANNEVEKIKLQIEQLKKEIEHIESKADEDFEQVKTEIESIEERIKNGKEYLKNNNPIDTSKLEQSVEEFEEKKELVSIHDRAKELLAEYEATSKQAAKLDEIVKVLREKPQELIENAEIPISGLSVKNNVVKIYDRPINNLSEGEKVIIALKIARATAGELKFINVDGIEKLDPDNKELLMKEAEKDDFQYFITQATSDEELIMESKQGAMPMFDPETGEIIEEVD